MGTFAFFLLDYILILAETARWYWPLAVWSKITFASLLNLLLSPFFFYLVGLPPRLCGWKPDHESRSDVMLADDIRVQGWRLGVLALMVFSAPSGCS